MALTLCVPMPEPTSASAKRSSEAVSHVSRTKSLVCLPTCPWICAFSQCLAYPLPSKRLAKDPSQLQEGDWRRTHWSYPEAWSPPCTLRHILPHPAVILRPGRHHSAACFACHHLTADALGRAISRTSQGLSEAVTEPNSSGLWAMGDLSLTVVSWGCA